MYDPPSIMQFWKDCTGLYIFWKVRAPVMLWYTWAYLTGNQCMIHSVCSTVAPPHTLFCGGTTCTHSLGCNLLPPYIFVCKVLLQDDVMYRTLHIIQVLHVLWCTGPYTFCRALENLSEFGWFMWRISLIV